MYLFAMPLSRARFPVKFGLAFLLLRAALPLTAQQLEPGTRVRMRPPCDTGGSCSPIIGLLHRISADSVEIVAGDGRLHTLQLTPTTRLDVSRGNRSRIAEGLAGGLLAGIIAGAIADAQCSNPSGDDSICGLWYLITVPPGILVGGIVGATFKTEWWLPPPGRVTVASSGSGSWQLGLRLGF